MLNTDKPTPCMQQNPELWFSKRKADQLRAKNFCLSCPVILQCLEDALETEKLMGQSLHGIHAATTPEERQTVRVKRIA